MVLTIYHPEGRTQAVVPDDITDEEVMEIIRIATTVKAGNGNGKIEYYGGKRLDGPLS